MTEQELNQAADIIFDRLSGFEQRTLQTIGRRIKATGQLSAYDQQALKNIADITGDMEAITKDLAEITGMNIADIEKIYTRVVTDKATQYKPLYDFLHLPFVPFAENEAAKRIVRQFATQTAGEMVNLSRTKALGFLDSSGNFKPLKGEYQRVIDEAVFNVASGVEDFNSAMRHTIEQLGGSGIKTHYVSESGKTVNVSLDSMVRSNILYGAKQCAQNYDREIGRELGCDGFEVDAHSNPRPSHEFMQGKMYSYSGEKTIDGVTYEDGAAALAALEDYGCLHFKTDVILGVSEPTYDREYLDRLHRENTKLIEYGGVKKTGYEWKQQQRALERAVRREKGVLSMAEASGDKTLARRSKERIAAYKAKYDDMCKKTGLQKTPERMATVGILTDQKNADIIDLYKGKGIRVEKDSSILSATISDIEQATKRVTSDIPSLERYSEPIVFGDIKDALAVNSFSTATGKNHITLNREAFSDINALILNLKKDYAEGISYKTSSIGSLIAHEMGHNAHVALALKRAGIAYGKSLSSINQALFEREYNQIAQEVYRVCFSNETIGEIYSKCVGELGSMTEGNARELIAQSFGNYYFGDEKSTIAKSIVAFFRKGLK